MKGKWVLKVLGQKGWLGGRIIENADHADGVVAKRKHQKKRAVNILEIGAINIELLTAASKTKRVAMKKSSQVKEIKKDGKRNSVGTASEKTAMRTSDVQRYENVPLYNLKCRAIDIRSSHELIEEQNFLTLPLPTAKDAYYDVVVW